VATAQVPKAQMKKIVINGQNVTQDSPISNDDTIELHVADFGGHSFCCLEISGVDYTDDVTAAARKKPGGTIVGTIKIGS